jgi:hypothetical protein
MEKMTFQEIFNQDGLYKADSFVEGFCFKVVAGCLYGMEYRDENDISPLQNVMLVSRHLFTKEYTKVFTRQSLFKK